jgi:hypothetical protein
MILPTASNKFNAAMQLFHIQAYNVTDIILPRSAAFHCDLAAIWVNGERWSAVIQGGTYWVAKHRCTRLAIALTDRSDTATHQDLNAVCRGRDRQATRPELAYFRRSGDVDSNARNVKLVRLDDAAKCAVETWGLPADVCAALENPAAAAARYA